jgi:hypothetical protein
VIGVNTALRVNNTIHVLSVDSRVTLLDALRDVLSLTGTSAFRYGATTELAFMPMNPGLWEPQARRGSGACHSPDWPRNRVIQRHSEAFRGASRIREPRSQDEGRTHEGLAAITAWKIEARRKYQYTVESLEATQRDGQTVVTARASGNFPGSPVTLTFIFRLEGEKIASLEIRP